MNTMAGRTIAIGDIHGHREALQAIIEVIDMRPDDTLVFLGDYVDHGPDSRGVLEKVIELHDRANVVALLGNHETMMLAGRDDLGFWKRCGGDTTIRSYGGDVGGIPSGHIAFLESLPMYHETGTHLFTHANYAPNKPLDQTDSQTALWLPLTDLPGPHYSGKIAIVGHTPQSDGAILDHGHVKCIDTGCGYGGVLTALDVGTGHTWQVTETGQTV